MTALLMLLYVFFARLEAKPEEIIRSWMSLHGFYRFMWARTNSSKGRNW